MEARDNRQNPSSNHTDPTGRIGAVLGPGTDPGLKSEGSARQAPAAAGSHPQAGSAANGGAATEIAPASAHGRAAATASVAPASAPRTWGYARVSAKDQNLSRQLDALAAFPVEERRIVCDKASGKDFQRPGYQRLVRRLRAGDVLVVMSIDRLGRNYDEILDEWRRLTQTIQVHMVVLDMPLLDTRPRPAAAGGALAQGGDLTGRFLADVTLELLSYVAQIERENTKRRQAEGIAAARARGVRFGRPRIEKPPEFAEVAAAYRAGELTRAQAAERCGVSVGTFDSWLRETGQAVPDTD